MAAVKVMLSFPPGILNEIDRIAELEQRSRSELLREAVQLYIQTRYARCRPVDDYRVKQAVAIQDALARQSPGTSEDSTVDIRRWREARR